MNDFSEAQLMVNITQHEVFHPSPLVSPPAGSPPRAALGRREDRPVDALPSARRPAPPHARHRPCRSLLWCPTRAGDENRAAQPNRGALRDVSPGAVRARRCYGSRLHHTHSSNSCSASENLPLTLAFIGVFFFLRLCFFKSLFWCHRSTAVYSRLLIISGRGSARY